MAWPTKEQLKERKAMAAANPREDDVATFVSQIGTLEMEEVPYRAAVLEGTESIPDDIADAMESLISSAVERRAKSKTFTMYDKFGIPSKVASERAQMMLQDKNPKGERTFFAKPPKDAPKVVLLDLKDTAATDALIKKGEPVLVAGKCDGCGKAIAENPHMVTPLPIADREDAEWRVNQLKFPHMYKRHRMLIPRFYRNKDQRDALLEFVR